MRVVELAVKYCGYLHFRPNADSPCPRVLRDGPSPTEKRLAKQRLLSRGARELCTLSLMSDMRRNDKRRAKFDNEPTEVVLVAPGHPPARFPVPGTTLG